MESLENLSYDEKERFKNSVQLIFNLFSNSRKEEILDIFLEGTISGIVIKSKYDTDGMDGMDGYVDPDPVNKNHYIIAYKEYDRDDPIGSLHASIHELIHVIGVPNEYKDFTEGKEPEGGLVISEYIQGEGYKIYGRTINECCDEILTKMALSMVQGANINYTADDVIMSNKVSHTSGYKAAIPIARLLAFAMNNEFDMEYSDLIKQGKGIVDTKTTLSSKDGEISLPVNDLFYGMAIDPIYAENRFNQFSKEGEYKRINKSLDEAFYNKNMSVNLLKDMMISISDMFNNKIYQYYLKGMISENTYNQCCEQYEKLFSSIKEHYEKTYDVDINFSHEDNLKMFESQIRAQEENKNRFLRNRQINTYLNVEAQEQIMRDMRERYTKQNHDNTGNNWR